MEMTPAQQQKLYTDVMAILGSIDWTDVAQLVAIVTGNAALQQQITAALLSYIHKELQAEVHYVDWTKSDHLFAHRVWTMMLRRYLLFKWNLFILEHFSMFYYQ